MSRARECWSVMLEWIGNKPQVLPLIEYHLGEQSGGSGTLIALQLNDANWKCKSRTDAKVIFAMLKHLCRGARFSPYIRLQLFEEAPPRTDHGPVRDRRLAFYRYGKAPDFTKLVKPPRTSKKKTAPKARAKLCPSAR